MAEAAARSGAEIRLKTAVCGIRDHAVLTRGMNGREEIGYRILIAADGPRATIARLLGMGRPRVFLSGIQADIPRDLDPDLVELYPSASPEFFGWAIPIGNGRARVGLCGCTSVKERFASFVKPWGGSCIHLVTGTLPLGVMPRTYGRRTLFVGDTAGFAKPTSGGGVYTGIRSAFHAAETAADCCSRGVFDDAALSVYERGWEEDFGRELALGFRIFRLRQQLTPQDIDTLCRTMSDPSVIDTIIKYGDMDRQGRLIRKLLKKPALYRCMGTFVGSGFRSLFA
jgi:flavin-dependent dehydrogenase